MAGAIVGTVIFFVLGSLAGAKVAQYLVDRELRVQAAQA
jgi:hypothetical protein